MANKSSLYILWTNDNPITAEKMVFMYGINSYLQEWWDNVTIIIWGATVKLAAENIDIQNKIKEALEKGVHITACRACAEQLGVAEVLEEMDIEVIYWGEPLTKLLKGRETLITI